MNPEIDDDQMLLLSQYYPTDDQILYNQFVHVEQEAAESSKPRRRRKKNRGGDEGGGGADGGIRKRKLSEEQVNMLEMSFVNEQKLDSERKERLAAEIGLDPRQVAVWFQNRRAKLKSKKLEDDYSNLKSQQDTAIVDICNLQTQLVKVKGQLDEAEKEKQRLLDGFSSNSPISSCFSMDPIFLGAENQVQDYHNMNLYVNGLEWDNLYIM